jgi:branched-chain amino acid transport system ATP-binding protein
MSLLEIKNLSKYFGGLAALDDVTLDVWDYEILGLIGPNGAGKTTMFNVITGFYPPTRGKVIFKGEDISGLRADEITQRGIGRTFQTTTLFMEQTVFDNVLIGFYIPRRLGRRNRPLGKKLWRYWSS